MSDVAQARARKADVRRQGFLWFGVAVLLAACVYGAWWWLTGRYSETTDDAYVAGNIVAVTSRENATVTALYADNTQGVRRGQLLIEMDPSVADVALRAAAANLARAERLIRDAARKGAQIICLKELFNATYFCKAQQCDRFDLAEGL
jgi:membrane fusion protein (multidrug efflux system)